MIDIRRGEKMHETLLINEVCAKAMDMGDFYHIHVDNGGLNYDKFFEEGDEEGISLPHLILTIPAV